MDYLSADVGSGKKSARQNGADTFTRRGVRTDNHKLDHSGSLSKGAGHPGQTAKYSIWSRAPPACSEGCNHRGNLISGVVHLFTDSEGCVKTKCTFAQRRTPAGHLVRRYPVFAAKQIDSRLRDQGHAKFGREVAGRITKAGSAQLGIQPVGIGPHLGTSYPERGKNRRARDMVFLPLAVQHVRPDEPGKETIRLA